MLMSFCLDDVWTNRFPLVKKPGIKLTSLEVVNDLKELISQKDNEMLLNIFDIYAGQEVNDFIKEQIEE